MKLVFMGTPELAVFSLKTIHHNASRHNHELLAVISQPSRPQGRKQIIILPPIAQFADEMKIPLLQPEKASCPEFIAELRSLSPDVIITAAYGQILSEDFLQIPKRAVINIHPSLLPRYRGATPVQTALMDGNTETGVTILFTVKKLDAGPIILQEKTPILPEETSFILLKRLFERGGELIWSALESLATPSFSGFPQDESLATYSKKIEKNDGRINWNSSAQDIFNRYRAFEPWPGSFTCFQGKRVILSEMILSKDNCANKTQSSGSFSFDKNNMALEVTTENGFILVKALKPEGSKVMDASSFWNGIREKQATKFDF